TKGAWSILEELVLLGGGGAGRVEGSNRAGDGGASTGRGAWVFLLYAAHQLNLQPRVSVPETSPTLRWTGKVGDASVFRVWGSRAFVRNLSADKLSPRAVPCAPGPSAPAATTATTTTTAATATAATATMASLRVLAFDHEGRPTHFDTWLDDLQLYLLSDSKDHVSLFDLASGAATAPPATPDSATRS
ncbi:unnamed protein product, partial [Closterium sp. NIES-54]